MLDQLPKYGHSIRGSGEEDITVKWDEIQGFRTEEGELAG